MSKLVEIVNCNFCPDYTSAVSWCSKVGRRIDLGLSKYNAFPQECPLPNAPEGAYCADTTKEKI
jgi:hypothetical protein